MMKKWLYLLTALAVWQCLGVIFFRPGRTDLPSADNPPQRIVSLGPNLTEILFEMGVGSRVVAVADESNYPPEAEQKRRVGSFWQINIESVIGSRPDLIVTLGFPRQREAAQRLSRAGYAVLTVDIDDIAGLYDAIGKIGEAVGEGSSARGLVDRIKNTIAGIPKPADEDARAKVLWVVQRNPLRVAGTETFINELITLAGGRNAIGDTLQKYPPLGAEQVIGCRADVIIEPAMSADDLARRQEEAVRFYRVGFSSLPAVKNGRIYVIDPDTVSRLGPRTGAGIETIAGCIAAAAEN